MSGMLAGPHGERLRSLERALTRPSEGVFGEGEVERLPEPIARYFRAAIAPGTPLATSARIEMRGRIKLKRWMPFEGTELIAPCSGFVWAVRAGPVRGYDRYVDGEGEMRWKLLGLVPVLHAAGPNVTRSAAARAAGEGTWIPTAILPRFGVDWVAVEDRRLVSRHRLDGRVLEYDHMLDDEGRIVCTRFERWGDPDSTGTFSLHPFGVETTAHRTFGGLTVPAAGRAGWHHGTHRWEDGVFFEYEITGLQPIV
jgi:hypothetical protein